jgi:transcriptional regulator with XRE-family HTH domain
MEILKSIRDKFGLSQQDMATLLGLTREHYSMVEIGRRMLPAEPVQLFAAMLPLFLENKPLPPMPEKIPESQASEASKLYNKAKMDLYKAEKDLQNCQTAISQQRHLTHLLTELPKLNGLNLSNSAVKLLEILAGLNQPSAKTNLLGKWALLNTQYQLCAQAVEAYHQLLENDPVK